MRVEEFKKLSKKEQLKILRPIIDLSVKMLLAGTLKKNVKAHWINMGVTDEAADYFVEIATIKAQDFSYYKLK